MSIRTIAACAAAALAFSAPVRAGEAPDVLINEVDADQVGTDSVEFFELYSASGAVSLDDCFVVLYNGSDDEEYLTFDLDGQTTPADGFYVVGAATVPNVDYTPSNFPATNAIQNGADAVALYFDTTGLLVNTDFFDTPAGSPPAGAVLIDAVVYDTSDADDAGLLAALTPGHVQVNEGGGTSANPTLDSCQRVPDGGTAFDTESYVVQPPTPGASNAPASPWTDLGDGLAGTLGVPALLGTGTLVGGEAAALDLTGAAASAQAVMFVSFTGTRTPFKGGTLVANPVDIAIPAVTSGGGEILLPFTWPTGVPSGFDLFFQYGVQDAGGPQGVAMSNACQAITP